MNVTSLTTSPPRRDSSSSIQKSPSGQGELPDLDGVGVLPAPRGPQHPGPPGEDGQHRRQQVVDEAEGEVAQEGLLERQRGVLLSKRALRPARRRTGRACAPGGPGRTRGAAADRSRGRRGRGAMAPPGQRGPPAGIDRRKVASGEAKDGVRATSPAAGRAVASGVPAPGEGAGASAYGERRRGAVLLAPRGTSRDGRAPTREGSRRRGRRASARVRRRRGPRPPCRVAGRVVASRTLSVRRPGGPGAR